MGGLRSQVVHQLLKPLRESRPKVIRVDNHKELVMVSAFNPFIPVWFLVSTAEPRHYSTQELNTHSQSTSLVASINLRTSQELKSHTRL